MSTPTPSFSKALYLLIKLDYSTGGVFNPVWFIYGVVALNHCLQHLSKLTVKFVSAKQLMGKGSKHTAPIRQHIVRTTTLTSLKLVSVEGGAHTGTREAGIVIPGGRK